MERHDSRVKNKTPFPLSVKGRGTNALDQAAGTLSAAAASSGTYVSMMYGIDKGDGADTAMTFVSPTIGA
jgi:hypothetical protein